MRPIAPEIPASLVPAAPVAGALVDVFISYARAEVTFARALAETLREEGFSVWFDEKIYAGAQWEALLLSTLATAKAVLVVWSTTSLTRPWVLREARLAIETGRIVPITIDDVVLPDEFRTHQLAKMAGWDGSGAHPELERLLTGLSQLAPPSRIETVRPGFDTEFLGRTVDLPAVTGVADEFRYLHFSVVMNPARRLAWYVAYNLAPRVEVDRGDRWMPDPALPLSFQPANDHYVMTGFDRGHLVAPAAVSWGTEREAALANRQSFFWTNTAPQLPQMNRRWWLAVEHYERALAERFGRLVGFGGPVLAPDDPAERELEQRIGRLRVRQNFRRPRRFWKVLVAVDAAGALAVDAFLWDQDALAADPPSSGTSVEPYRATVATIESITGLDLGEDVRSAPAIAVASNTSGPGGDRPDPE